MTLAFLFSAAMIVINALLVVGSTAGHKDGRNYRAASIGIAIWNFVAMTLIALCLALQWWANALNDR